AANTGALLADVSATTFTVVSLSTNSSFALTVQPYVGAYFGALSAASTVYTSAAVPSALDAVSLGTGSIRLDWSDAGNPPVTVYEVTLSTVGFPLSVSTPIAQSDQYASTSAAFGGLAPGTTHYWRVRAFNGDGVPTDYAAASTQTLPGAVGSFAGSALGVSSISWTWAATAGPAAGSYEVVRASDGVVLSSGPSTSFIETSLSSDTAYGLQVRAVGGAGAGALTSAATVYTRAAEPSGTAVAAVFVDSVTLGWSASGNPPSTQYAVEVASPGGPFILFSTAAGTSRSVVNLLADTTDQFRVRAVNGDGLPSGFDAVVSTYVPGQVPSVVSAFRAVPAGSARILLSWTMSPTTTTARYDIFSDSATGTVDYSVAFASVTAPQTSYETPPLTANATYTFGIRVVDERGQSEKNRSVQASALALSTAPPLSAYVGFPSGGSRVWGDRLTVSAAMAAGLSTQLGRLTFQFRASSSAAWQDMTAAEAAHPNPVTAAPFLTFWDVTGLAAGSYQVRAAAEDQNGVGDTAPPVTTLTVDSVSPDVSESLVTPGRVKARLRVYSSAPAELDLADPTHAFTTTVSLSSGCVAASEDVLTVDGAPTAPPATSSFSAAGIYRDISLQSGQTALSGGRCARLSFARLDQNGDRRVDGTETRSDNLVVTFYDTAASAWRVDFPSRVLPDDGVTLQADTPHFTLFSVVSPAAPDLSTVRVYPVPWRPNDGVADTGKPYSSSDPTSGIIFDDLPADARLEVFTVAGSLVWDAPGPAQGGLRRWDVRNGDGRDVASGVYFLVVTAPGGATRVEKLVVIR
ncbi:MAG: fibronectin type III domain-containing protein, partial [Elusimicrobia bacterium]|nr:fibronectin type III domain-containing protein [Elusimicrobiota bacterium]